jgi:multimeric flavodoxin WrbA/nitrite reductase/ring-hydroxylating ferredoxin subunit
MDETRWHDVGSESELRERGLTPLKIGRTRVAVSCVHGEFGAVSGVCNHAAGPLGEGRLDGEYLVCPWHNYKYHFRTGEGEPGFEEDRVPRHEVRLEGGRVLVSLDAVTTRNKPHHDPHPLERRLVREEGPLRVLGIGTTAMDEANPRYSTSESLLRTALAHAADALGAQTRLIRLRELKFRACEGYYSKSAHACTWPCSITQMDPDDQMERVYEGIVFWADVILVATPIRWGNASALYFKMTERLNCVQNQITLRNRVMLRNKVASFIVTGGQDNVQAVAGQMLVFFAELGCAFPQFPFIGHSRGWEAEDMENNVRHVRESGALHDGARELAERAVHLAKVLLETELSMPHIQRGGRKASGGVEAGIEG